MTMSTELTNALLQTFFWRFYHIKIFYLVNLRAQTIMITDFNIANASTPNVFVNSKGYGVKNHLLLKLLV